MKRHGIALALLVAAALMAQTGPLYGQPQQQGWNNRLQAPPASSTEAGYQAAAKSAARKFDHIQENARRKRPDQRPTVLTEREINSYLSSGQLKLPVGVRSLHLTGTPGVLNGTAQIDFDAITASKRSGNPLMAMLFSGVHQVEAVAHASGGGGQGQVHIDTISIDGVAVPRMALDFFIERYVKPKHPEIGIDSTFKMPERLDIAVVGDHILTVTQK